MSHRLLVRMRELVRDGRYVVTLHAAEEMEADGLTVYDIEHCVLTGRIVHRQRDRVTRESKSLIRGATLSEGSAVVVAKIGPTGMLVIITVYAV